VSIAYLNGEFLPREKACVPVMDRGFLFGDGVYEVIPVYAGRLFRRPHHLKRLQNSLDAVRIANPMTVEDWTAMLEELVARNGGGDQSLYLQVTRGVAPRRDHAFPDETRPTVFAMSTQSAPPAASDRTQGIAAITLPDIRWQHCNVKAITLLPNVLLRQQAVDAASVEAILIRDGYATEGAASNLFIARHGLLITPPDGPDLLPGITRDLILELAATNGVPFREAAIPEQDLARADEIWITSSTREIAPVVRLNGAPVSDGRPGPLWRRMIGYYQDYKDALRRGEKE
jgi:D-alanine transaminase